jgi:enoyl-[acyl-carrier protein] reductase/trans-2-enoyl-CoA reductase (NAD+)
MSATARVSNGICLDVSPAGCARHVAEQVAAVRQLPPIAGGPRAVLVLGASGGYGLATRVVAAFGAGARTFGVSFERVPCEKRGGSPGWYNNQAFDEASRQHGLVSITQVADAYRPEAKAGVVAAARANGFEKFDLVVYSLAAPARTDPVTGEIYRTAIKPIGKPYSALTLNLANGSLKTTTIAPATEEEIAGTVKVMGGEDWQLWIEALLSAGLLHEGVKTLAFSYLGPACTRAVYRSGTLGRAKAHLEATAHELTARLAPLSGSAHVAICKALVTRASAVIPAMPLYLAALYRVMKNRGLHENCLDQMNRLFRQRLYTGRAIPVDEAGRIRLDDWEMRDDVQAGVAAILNEVTPENVWSLVDFEGYQRDFLALHGL